MKKVFQFIFSERNIFTIHSLYFYTVFVPLSELLCPTCETQLLFDHRQIITALCFIVSSPQTVLWSKKNWFLFPKREHRGLQSANIAVWLNTNMCFKLRLQVIRLLFIYFQSNYLHIFAGAVFSFPLQVGAIFQNFVTSILKKYKLILITEIMQAESV